MRTLRRSFTVLAIAAIVASWPAAAAWAHPLGNFTVNRSAALTLSPGRLDVDYVVDHAEIPTQQELASIGTGGGATPSGSDLRAWADDAAHETATGLRAEVDGIEVALQVECATAGTAEGQGGLPVLRLEVGLTASIPDGGTLVWSDGNDPERLGWREVTARGATGTALSASTAPVVSPSDRLRAYPEDLLSDPVDVREARLTYGPGAGGDPPAPPCSSGAAAGPGASAPGAGGGVTGGNLGLLDREGTPLVFAVALLLAAGFGAIHALGPGHGKTLIAGTVVGAGARVRQAVAVGGAVSVMHTASVLALGLLVLGLERTFRPEQVYPWLGLASGLAALALGAWLLVRRLGAWAERSREAEHAGGHEHRHGHGPGQHVHGVPEGPVLSRRGLTALAIAGGILPSPTALVVLLSAISLGRVAFGLALIAAFSVGLAAALVGVGLVTIRARDALAGRMSSRIGRLVPVVSSAGVVAVGAVLTVRGIAGL